MKGLDDRVGAVALGLWREALEPRGEAPPERKKDRRSGPAAPRTIVSSTSCRWRDRSVAIRHRSDCLEIGSVSPVQAVKVRQRSLAKHFDSHILSR